MVDRAALKVMASGLPALSIWLKPLALSASVMNCVITLRWSGGIAYRSLRYSFAVIDPFMKALATCCMAGVISPSMTFRSLAAAEELYQSCSMILPLWVLFAMAWSRVFIVPV